MADARFIDWHGRRVALKWHRARKHVTDTAFTGARIVEGMCSGASVEVDINRIADGGFVDIRTGCCRKAVKLCAGWHLACNPLS